MTHDELHKMVDKCATELGEYFDAVQILVTWNEESRTLDLVCGSGNWYARQGLAREFILQNQSMVNAHELSKVDLHMAKPPEEEDASTD